MVTACPETYLKDEATTQMMVEFELHSIFDVLDENQKGNKHKNQIIQLSPVPCILHDVGLPHLGKHCSVPDNYPRHLDYGYTHLGDSLSTKSY